MAHQLFNRLTQARELKQRSHARTSVFVIVFVGSGASSNLLWLHSRERVSMHALTPKGGFFGGGGIGCRHKLRVRVADTAAHTEAHRLGSRHGNRLGDSCACSSSSGRSRQQPAPVHLFMPPPYTRGWHHGNDVIQMRRFAQLQIFADSAGKLRAPPAHALLTLFTEAREWNCASISAYGQCERLSCGTLIDRNPRARSIASRGPKVPARQVCHAKEAGGEAAGAIMPMFTSTK